jgi:protoheme IX farnesyltransferase
MSGIIYLLAAIILGGFFLNYAVRMLRQVDDTELPMNMFRFSISYLGFLFAALLIDHYLLFQLSIA